MNSLYKGPLSDREFLEMIGVDVTPRMSSLLRSVILSSERGNSVPENASQAFLVHLEARRRLDFASLSHLMDLISEARI